MNILSKIAIVSSLSAAVSREDIIFILSILVTILNLIMEYMKGRRKKDESNTTLEKD